MHTGYLALGSGRPGWQDPKPEGLTPLSAVREVGSVRAHMALAVELEGPARCEPGPSPQAPRWAPNVRTPWQDKESPGVLRGFIGHSLPGKRSSSEQGECGSLQPVARGGGTYIPWQMWTWWDLSIYG